MPEELDRRVPKTKEHEGPQERAVREADETQGKPRKASIDSTGVEDGVAGTGGVNKAQDRLDDVGERS